VTDLAYSVNFCILRHSAVFQALILTESIISAICGPKRYENWRKIFILNIITGKR